MSSPSYLLYLATVTLCTASLPLLGASQEPVLQVAPTPPDAVLLAKTEASIHNARKVSTVVQHDGQRIVTVHKIAPPKLPDAPVGVPASAGSGSAPTADTLKRELQPDPIGVSPVGVPASAGSISAPKDYKLLALSGEVHPEYSEIRWTFDGQEFTAYSSIDFTLFDTVSDFETASTVYSCLFMVADQRAQPTTANALAPNRLDALQHLKPGLASYVVVTDYAETDDSPFIALEALHEWYDANLETLRKRHQDNQSQQTAEQQRLRDNPPPTNKAVDIYYWRKDN
ncbi:MAG: hypothetical protein SFY80_02925 [Verrucomicrobiota bacterium]|nr:hypothetical protein [Verrucomicrobiota bacterium]